MLAEEADKIISEFMGWRAEKLVASSAGPLWISPSGNPGIIPSYSQSLDALVPVWEKLKQGICPRSIGVGIYPKYYDTPDSCLAVKVFGYEDIEDFTLSATDKTIQEITAIATAKTIQELR